MDEWRNSGVCINSACSCKNSHKMILTQSYLEMLQFPNSPKVYRELRRHYRQLGKHHEAEAFTHLLKVRYNEMPDNDHDVDIDQKP